MHVLLPPLCVRPQFVPNGLWYPPPVWAGLHVTITLACAQELLKLATVLQQAMDMQKEQDDDRDIHAEEVLRTAESFGTSSAVRHRTSAAASPPLISLGTWGLTMATKKHYDIAAAIGCLWMVVALKEIESGCLLQNT